MSAPTVETIIISKLDALDIKVEDKFERLSDKVETIMRNGCSKVEAHNSVRRHQDEIFSRLNIIEKAQAEGKGRLAIVMILAGAILSLVMQWIGKRL